MASDPAVWGLATISMSMALTAATAFNPPLTEVRKRSREDTTFAGDVRLGELATLLVSVGVGTISSSISGSPVPAIIGIIVGLGLVALYESALQTEVTANGQG